MLHTAINAAKAAGEILQKSFGKDVKVYDKGESDFYTDSDLECEHKIREIILKQYPDHEFLGEEHGRTEGQNEHVWIVDPLDGTANFIAGIPLFSVSIALEISGELEVGVVCNPISGELFTAEKGKGAYLNGERLKISDQKDSSKAIFAFGRGYGEEEQQKFINIFSRLHNKIRGTRIIGSAAIDLAYTAAGKLDGYACIGGKLWDYAAGALLVQESGGTLLNLDGLPWHFFEPNIVAGNVRMVDAILGKI